MDKGTQVTGIGPTQVESYQKFQNIQLNVKLNKNGYLFWTMQAKSTWIYQSGNSN